MIGDIKQFYVYNWIRCAQTLLSWWSLWIVSTPASIDPPLIWGRHSFIHKLLHRLQSNFAFPDLTWCRWKIPQIKKTKQNPFFLTVEIFNSSPVSPSLSLCAFLQFPPPPSLFFSQNSNAISGSSRWKMAAVLSPITRQVSKETREPERVCIDIHLEDVEDCLVYDRRGVSVPFKNLYQHGKSVIIFVRVRKVYKLFWSKCAYNLLAIECLISCRISCATPVKNMWKIWAKYLRTFWR